ncbi:vanillate O-demethylase oxidoreductase VanB [Acuticoccus sediminis]|uniref:Vanillate O-demethylase oxidoreductase VanB n=1 Tax=Acuticoccus sediminis TaxID=2184697 RepID=A0A8B2NX95_9HYPH|nr:SRPBCC family protein [Acuticoccus sediminis]RAI03290.1 vanillate O-demethylase oxidoreductase VanB [Acuticoccus sediminis]
MTDAIEKTILLDAPVERVWRAVTDAREFGTWFRVALEGPFVPGRSVAGQITYPGYEHHRLVATVETMEEPRYFAFRWEPEPDTAGGGGGDPATLVEFTLAPEGTGTRLTLRESGFNALPAHKRDEALRRNDGGWDIQMQNIADHLSGSAAAPRA